MRKPEPTYTVSVVILATGEERQVGPAKTLAAAVRKARDLTDGGLMNGPTNEVRVHEDGRVVHRFRRLTHGSLGRRGGSFSAKPVEVDEKGSPGTTTRFFGTAMGPEAGDAFCSAMFDSARGKKSKAEVADG